MDITTRRKEASDLLNAICWLRDFSDCTGPLGDKPTNDPGVQVLCSAIRHLARKYKAVR